MKKILIVEGNTTDLIDYGLRNDLSSPADCYANALRYFNPDYEYITVRPYEKALDEGFLRDCDGAAFTGSNVTWGADSPKAEPLRIVMEQLFTFGKPVIGSCNGLQIAANLLGGKLGPSDNGFEIGLAQNIRLTEAGEVHPMMRGRHKIYVAPVIHRDEVQELPQGSVLLSGNDHSEVQAFVYQQNGVDFWGMQYHPEMRPRDIASTLRIRSGIFSHTDQLISDLSLVESDEAVAKRLGTSIIDQLPEMRMVELKNWLSYLQR